MQRASLRLRRQKLLPYPDIEFVNTLDVETFLQTNFNIVKYGDYEFKESLDGFVHVYISACEITNHFKRNCGYAVFYRKDHPL